MQLKKYSFPFGLTLDDGGHERQTRLANDADLDDLLCGEAETSPSEYLHALTKQEMDRFPQLDYRQALSRVQDRNPKLCRLYASESAGRLRVY